MSRFRWSKDWTGAVSVHRMLGSVAIAGDDFNFHIFALLVFYFELAAVGSHHLHFQLAVGAVQFAVGGMVGEGVLLANVFANFLEDLGKLGLETREESAASGHGREILQLIIGLQVVEIGRHTSELQSPCNLVCRLL